MRLVDILAFEEYSYYYEEGRITRAVECDVTINADGNTTAKTVVNTLQYYYNGDGELIRRHLIPASDTYRQISFYEEDANGAKVLKVKHNEKVYISHSRNDSFGRKEFDEVQTGWGTISRQFFYTAGKAPSVYTTYSDRGNLKSSPTTNLVSQITLSDGRTLSYEYDAEERITKVTDSVDGITEYTYDALGQLLTETVNDTLVNTMTYDKYGNILTKNGKTYTYDEVWKDMLCVYGGQVILHDVQGNPIKYLGHDLTWEKGRQLKSFDSNTYTYNANGIRTSKTVNGVKHTYTLDGVKILRETWGDNTLIPLYDNEDSVCGILYNDTPYYFLKNLQGDIIAITNQNGQTIAKYRYDAWGKCTITSDTSGSNISGINPFRYRGYYYDPEIGMYYLQSRYFDPTIGRFLNGDDANCLGAEMTCTSCNVYSYCVNDPINLADFAGRFSWSIFPKIVKFLSDLAGKLSDFLLSKYGLSKKKYAHKLKYKNANALTQFVNDKKKTLKKIKNNSSSVVSCLEILIICTECYSRIKSHSSSGLFKTVASLAFYCVANVIGKAAGAIITWVITKLSVALRFFKKIIKLALETIIDYVMDLPWFNTLENKFVSYADSKKTKVGDFVSTFFRAAKACYS